MTIGETVSDKTALLVVIVCLISCLSGCGGTKILKEQEPLLLTEPLVAGTDQRAAVHLDWVIVRGGPGTWAKNADWDEYLLRVENRSDEPITLNSIVVYDSTSFMHEAVGNRKSLVKGSRKTAKRYKGQDIKIKAGVGGAALVVAGGLGATLAMGAGSAAVYGSGAVLGAAAGAVVLAPVLVVGGVLRGVNNSKVNSEIENRQTQFPVIVGPGELQGLDLFFPLTPSPQRLEISYATAEAEFVLAVETSVSLDGLHLVPQE